MRRGVAQNPCLNDCGVNGTVDVQYTWTLLDARNEVTQFPPSQSSPTAVCDSFPTATEPFVGLYLVVTVLMTSESEDIQLRESFANAMVIRMRDITTCRLRRRLASYPRQTLEKAMEVNARMEVNEDHDSVVEEYMAMMGEDLEACMSGHNDEQESVESKLCFWVLSLLMLTGGVRKDEELEENQTSQSWRRLKSGNKQFLWTNRNKLDFGERVWNVFASAGVEFKRGGATSCQWEIQSIVKSKVRKVTLIVGPKHQERRRSTATECVYDTACSGAM